MHLSYSTSRHKDRIYKSYTIAESYRDGKTVRKRPIWRIGKLSDQQAEQIKMILKVTQSEDQVITQFKDIVVKETKAYLDIAIVNELWNQWKLDQAFEFNNTNSALNTNTIAKILTINRCTDPCSHYSVPAWAKKVALEDILDVDLLVLNDDKIYYELDKIDLNQTAIENHIFNLTCNKNPGSYEFINYDLSTSYFVGYKCSLSAFGKGKSECHGRRQVLLGVLINDDGYPFKWDVSPGNMAEVNTLKRNINACKTRFNLKSKGVTIVFDRGSISNDNANLIEDAEMKYISALDRNQIPSCGVELTPLRGISVDKNNGNVPKPLGYKKYDDELFFYDSGIIGDKRYVVGLNPTLLKEDRSNREDKINFFKAYLKKENKGLANAKRDRDFDTTKGRIINEMKRLKIKKYFHLPELTPIKVQNKLKNGTVKAVKSFKAEIKQKSDVIKNDKLLDGVCVFLTNHTEKQGRSFKVTPQSIIKAYRDKTKIEDVFKNVKSFLKLRPFFVNTDAHVKAVYTICILAYFINKYLTNKRKALGEKDYLNSKELYAPFKDIDIATLADSNTGKTIKKSAELPSGTVKLLEALGLSHVAANK